MVKGIALLTLLWTDGKALIPCDFRVYDKPLSGQTKNDHFRAMLKKGRGLEPEYVLMDSWYAGLENLKLIASWGFLTRLKSNRMVNPDGKGNVPISHVDIPPEGLVVHLRGFGFVKVFKTVSKNGDAEYWATNDLHEERRASLERAGWGDRGLPSGPETMLWSREDPGPESHRPHQAPFTLFTSFFEAGGLSFKDRGELV